MDEYISRILKMLEEGKISASEAEKLLSALRTAPPEPPVPPTPPPSSRTFEFRQDTRSDSKTEPKTETSGSNSEGNAKSFEFSWSHKKGFPFDLSGLGKQISEAVRKIDPEKLVREARVGVSKGGKRWQDRMKEWGRFMSGDDGPPENTLGQPSSRVTESLSFTVAPDASLQVENRFGAIYVIGGSQDVTVEIEKEAWSETEEEAQAHLKDLRVEALTQQSPTVGASRLEVRVTAPEEWRDGWANLRLRVPEGVTLKLETVFGEIRVENTAGQVEVHSISAPITLERLRGEVRAESISGDLRAVEIQGALRLAAKSGDVSAEKLLHGGEIHSVSGMVRLSGVEGGPIEARSVSGDVRLEEAGQQAPYDICIEAVSGDVVLNRVRGGLVTMKTISGDIKAETFEAATIQAETVSGDVRTTLSGPFSGTLTTSTVSGEVEITLSEASSFRYTLGTQSGDIECELPAQDITRTESLATGSVGAGQGTVTIHSRSGDVRLKR